jgi:hypothetical protein
MADGSVSALIVNPVTGSGTTNYIPKWTSGSAVGNSQIFDNGTSVGINTATPGSSFVLDVTARDGIYNTRFYQPSSATTSYNSILISGAMTSAVAYFGIGGSATGNTSFRDTVVIGSQSSSSLVFNTADAEKMRLFTNGNLLIGTNATDSGFKLDVTGTLRANRIFGNYTTVLDTYTTVNPSTNVILASPPNDRDAWIYRDQADGSSNWGIYHRQIDSSIANLPANSIGFIGNGTSSLRAYIALATGNGYFAGNLLLGTTTDSGFRLDVNGTSAFRNIVSIDAGAFGSEALVLNSSVNQQYIAINSATGYEAMTKYYNPTAGNWYTGIRVNAGLGSTASYHIYSSTYGNDTFVLNTDGTARFAGSVTSNLGFEIPNGQFYRARRSSGSLLTDMIGIPSGTDDVRVLTTGDFNIINGSLVNILAVKNNGSVGIGTTSPDAIFHVARSNAGGLGGQIVIDNPGSSTIGSSVEISFLTDAGASGAGVRNARIRAVNENAGNGAANMQFWTWNGGSDAERMRLSPAGNLLINNTTDNGLGVLQVNGNIIIAGGSSSGQSMLSSGFTSLRFPNQYSSGFTDAGVKLFIFNSGSTIQGFTAGPSFDLQYHSSGSSSGRHAFYVGNTEIIRFNQTTVVSTGSITATSFFESSDIKLKTLIDGSPQIAGIENLQAKLYEKNGKIELGYFAQDAEKIMPYAVTKGTDGFLSLSYREVHTAKIARLEKRVAELEKQLNLN